MAASKAVAKRDSEGMEKKNQNGPQGQNQAGSNNNRDNRNNRQGGQSGGGGGNRKDGPPQGHQSQHQSQKQHGGHEGGHQGGGGGGHRGRPDRDPIHEKLRSAAGPTSHLQSREGPTPIKKFTGRCRLFVGNLPNSITEVEFKKLFEKYGETAEEFLNVSKGFGFIKLDTRQHAETAKAALDFSNLNGKVLRVRFATHGAALKVKNLTPYVSNELLEGAFSIFGDVERAIVVVDDRGRPIGEGIVEYSRKQAAQTALKRCTDGCFMLTGAPRPVQVEPLDQRDEEDGFPEKNFQKNNNQYLQERDKGPRLAEVGSFEYEFAMRWKKLYDVERQKRERLEEEIQEARKALEDQQEFSIYEHQTNVLREKLREMEEQSTMLQREREMRLQEERHREEQRRAEEKRLRQQEEEILRRRNVGNMSMNMVEDMRRRQEDSLRMQASTLSDLLDRQEAQLRGIPGGDHQGSGMEMGPNGPGNGPNRGPGGSSRQGGGGGGMGMSQRQSRFDQPSNMGGPGGPMSHGNGGPPLGIRGGNGPRGNSDMMDRRREMIDDYGMDPKRRRY